MSTEITITSTTIDINVSEYPITIEAPSGAYPLPASVYTVFGRAGNVIAVDGDYNLTQLGDVTITGPLTGQVLRYNGTAWVNNTETYVGTVTSVAATVPTGLTITGSPITTSGTLAFGLASGYTIPLSTQLVPTGGTIGQILAKNSATNYDTTWIDNYTEQLRDTVKASVVITKGQAVYISGSNGTNQLVSLASNATEETSSKTLGLAAQNFAINEIGQIITEGLLTGINTSTATAGDPVWLGINGNLIFGLTNKPVAPAHLVYIGVVTRVQSVNGEIYVKIQNGFELQELHNVSITSPANGNILQYDSATSLWKNVAGTTTNIAEGTNLYYTDARARASNSFVAGSGAYNSTTGVITIPTNNNQITNGSAYITLTGLSATTPLSYVNTTGVFSISQSNTSTNGYLSFTDWNTFNGKQAALNGTGFVKATGTTISYDNSTYLTTIAGITAGGELSGTYASPSLVTSAVTGKLLTGVNITGGSVVATDSILTAFGKVQNQINGLIGGSIYKGTWNASTNTPTLTSSVGTSGNYYIVSVAGTTNLNGITDWQVGDWAIFQGSVWQKVDNTDSVVSVNGFTGAVSLTTSNISEGTSLYYTNARTIASSLTGYVSGAGTIASTDTILTAIQKLNGNVGSLVTGVSSVFGRTGVIVATSGDYTTTQVTEGTNLYYTDARSRAAISDTVTGLDYNSTTGVWSTTSGYAIPTTASATNWDTAYTNRITSLTTTGTSGAATLTANTLNIPQYQAALTNPVTGTGTTNILPKFTGASTIGNSIIFDNGTNVGIGNTNTTYNFDVTGTARITGDTTLASITASGSPFNIISNSGGNDINFKSGSNTMFNIRNTGATLSFGTFIVNANITGGASSTNRINSTTTLSGTQTSGSISMFYAGIGLSSFTLSAGALLIGYNFNLGSAPSGGGSTYAFSSNLNTGNNAYNLYLSGTAPSYLAGNLLLGSTTDSGTGILQVTGQSSFTGSVTAVSAIARGVNMTPTLIAAANSDVLTGLYINPTFTNGAFTGITNNGLIVAAGNTGLGTSTIGSKLQVNGNAAIGYSASTAAPANGLLVSGSVGINNTSPTEKLQIDSGNIVLVSGKYRMYNTGNSTYCDQSYTVDGYLIEMIGVKYLTAFRSTGNFVLQNGGTFVDAGYRLDVTGTGRFTGALTGTSATFAVSQNSTITNSFQNTNTTNTNTRNILNVTAGNVTLQLQAINADNVYISPTTAVNTYLGYNNSLTLASNGTSTFAGDLTIAARMYIKGGNQNSIWFNQNAGGSSTGFLVGRSLSNTDAQDFFIYDIAAATARMVITSGGNVGVGPTGTASTAVRLVVQGADATSSNYSFIATDNTGSTTLGVRNDGLIDTGTRARSPYNDVNSAAANLIVVAGGNLQRSTASSRRFKDNITDWSGKGLETILALKPKTFTYKESYYKYSEVVMLGLIAEEVAEVSEYLADYENQDRTGQVENVRYANIVVPLIKAIQEMNTKLDEQNQTIQSLQEQINILNNK